MIGRRAPDAPPQKSLLDSMYVDAQKSAQKGRKAATILQGAWRRTLAVRFMEDAFRSVVVEKFDAKHNCAYFVNTKTGTCMWTRPVLLGPRPLPQRVLCGDCQRAMGSVHCVQCTNPFCDDCFAKGHPPHTREGKHEAIPFPDGGVKMAICATCEDRLATHGCDECDDDFCAACFKTAHRAYKNGQRNSIAKHDALNVDIRAEAERLFGEKKEGGSESKTQQLSLGKGSSGGGGKGGPIQYRKGVVVSKKDINTTWKAAVDEGGFTCSKGATTFRAMEGGWIETVGDDGSLFFFNTETMENRHTPPGEDPGASGGGGSGEGAQGPAGGSAVYAARAAMFNQAKAEDQARDSREADLLGKLKRI